MNATRASEPNAGSNAKFLLPFLGATFLGAFLLFQVQLIAGKAILPLFGGSSSVWATCVMFFQLLLLAGYAYAHMSIRRLGPGPQVALHGALLALALGLLVGITRGGVPVLPNEELADLSGDPVPSLLLMLLAAIGLPFFVLAATSPLLQAWFVRGRPGMSPYPLYALSNAGSLAGLLTYPFLVERLMSLTQQAWTWFTGFAAFVVFCAAASASALHASSGHVESLPVETPEAPPPAAGTPDRENRPVALWIGLSACASVMFLGVTNKLCLNVAPVPFLWVLPLSIYLVSFIAAFAGERWYPRGAAYCLSAIAVAVFSVLGYEKLLIPGLPDYSVPMLLHIPILCLGLFFICLACHGELYRLRPPPRHLTGFYLAVAGGGALGGLAVSVVAPRIFPTYLELGLGLLLSFLVLFTCHCRDPIHPWPAQSERRQAVVHVAAVVAVLALGIQIARTELADFLSALFWKRNFYGTVHLRVFGRGADRSLALMHGTIRHGAQFTSDERRRQPTTYYGEASGIGLVMRHFPRQGPQKVCLVGLGAGTISAYARQRDVHRYYEINPIVIDLATRQEGDLGFTFLSDANRRGAVTTIVAGDARQSMRKDLAERRVAPGSFDVIVLDAFSSDAIPVHLLTVEAFALYRALLRRNGVIAVHTSNKYFDFPPVIFALAKEARFRAIHVLLRDDPKRVSNSSWVLLTNCDRFLDMPAIRDATAPAPEQSVRPWTDGYAALFSVLK